MLNKNIQDILKDLKTNLQNTYQQRLRELLLFGSYARGEEEPGSDVDIGLIIDDFGDIGKEIELTSGIVSKLSLQNNVVISLHPIREKDWINRKTPLILNLKREGVSIL